MTGYLIIGEIKFCNLNIVHSEKKDPKVKKYNIITFYDNLNAAGIGQMVVKSKKHFMHFDPAARVFILRTGAQDTPL